MKINELFPSKFVRGQDLSHTPVLAKLGVIEQVEVHPRPGVKEQKWVLLFESVDPAGKARPIAGVSRTAAGYAVILRKALMAQILEATGTTDTDEWPGKQVVFHACESRAGLTVCARAPKTKAE
ncbi:MAG: hypothetical protein M1546_00355 [Chloroflexi bacterium]|nr:hypothetical protein [Chloroflexota bacterium]